MYLGILILIVLIVVIMSMYNGLVQTRNMVQEAFSTMDVYLKQRSDLIPNVVAAVKGYATYEQETLEKIIRVRNSALSASNLQERQVTESELIGTLKSLFALAENYPELKANTQFLELQQQLKSVEADIANSRKYYNAVVKKMNTKVQMFPTSIIAMVFGFSVAEYFMANAGERDPIKVEF